MQKYKKNKKRQRERPITKYIDIQKTKKGNKEREAERQRDRER